MKSEEIFYQNQMYLRYEVKSETLKTLEYKMIAYNKIDNFLIGETKRINDKLYLIFSLNKCISLEKYIKEHLIREKEVIKIIIQIIENLSNLKNFFLLDLEKIEIRLDRIYYDYINNKVYLIYHPELSKVKISNSLKKLISQIKEISQINFKYSYYFQSILDYLDREIFNFDNFKYFLKEEFCKKDNKTSISKQETSLKVLDQELVLEKKSDKDKKNDKENQDLKILIFRGFLIEIIGIMAIRIIIRLLPIENIFLSIIIFLVVHVVIIFTIYKFIIKEYLDNEKHQYKKEKNDLKENRENNIKKNEVKKYINDVFKNNNLIYSNETKKFFLNLIHPTISEKIIISKDEFIIGSEISHVDYCLKDESISSLHIEIIITNEEIFIKDLHSINGTYVNGEKIYPDEVIKLYKKDVIKIGNLEYILEE